MRRGSRRLSLIFIALVASALVGLARPAYGHAYLERAEPRPDVTLDASPARLQLWFTEPMEPGFSEVQVFDANSQAVDNGDGRVTSSDLSSMTITLPPLEKGVYTVAWKALSAVDGHVTRGTYSLLIGVEAPAAPPVYVESVDLAPLDAPTRGLGYLGAAGLVGSLLFWLLILRPTSRRLTASSASGRLTAPVTEAVAPRLGRLLWAGWGAVLLSSLLSLGLQTLSTGGSPGLLLGTTRYGQLWLARLALLALVAVLLRLRPTQSRLNWPVVGVAGLILLPSSLNSHSAAVSQASTAMLVDWLHFLGVSVWVGGLFGLVLLLPAALAATPLSIRGVMLAGAIQRFSGLAVASVTLLTATGLYLTWLHVGSVDALLATLYGRSLLAKLALFGLLVLLGAVNLLVLSPRLSALAARRVTPDEETERRLARGERLAVRFGGVVRLEAVLAVLALLAAGALTSLSPARQTFERIEAARPLELIPPAGDLDLRLAISPARPGLNTFTVTLRDEQGHLLSDAERVDLRFTFLGRDLGTNIQPARPTGDGRYQLRGGWVGVEGRWQIDLLVRVPDREDVRTATRFVVTPTEARPDTPTQAEVVPSQQQVIVLALALTLIVGALAVYVARVTGFRSPAGGAVGLLSLASLVLVGVLFVRAGQTEAASSTWGLTNPFPSTQASIAQGEAVYRAQCQSCHGPRGRGDGPAAVALNPKPADFRVHMAAGHTDGDLFYWISEGVAGTGMAGFKDSLSPEERWHVVNFLKTFAPVTQ